MLRFMIRDVLWLTVVVALAIGWWFDHRNLWFKIYRTNLDTVGTAIDRYEMRKALESEGYTIQEDGHRWKVIPPSEKPN